MLFLIRLALHLQLARHIFPMICNTYARFHKLIDCEKFFFYSGNFFFFKSS